MFRPYPLTFALLIFVVVTPFLLWFAFYAAARLWSLNLSSTLPYLRAVRWVGWSIGTFLFLMHLIRHDFPRAPLGLTLLVFSTGLGMPENWVKRRFAPELLEESEPEEYWPRRHE